MRIIPETFSEGALDFELLPTKTYKINFDLTPSYGMIDGLEAVKQTIFCILSTERFQHAIYSWNYGVEIINKLGKIPEEWVLQELQSTICDALIQDNRITEVDSFQFEMVENDLLITFRVVTTVGTVEVKSSWWGEGLEVKV